MSRLNEIRETYKPFNYPWAYEEWLKHEQMHWLFTEVPMLEDVKDWKNVLTENEKEFLTNILRFFTLGDIDVSQAYVDNYLPYFKQPEVRMMLLGFAARECFDSETEVLTSKGWKLFKDIGLESKLAQLDTNTKELSFSKPLGYIKKPYEGKMHHYKNKATDICVTPNHRLYLIDSSTRKVQLTESSKSKWGGSYLYPTTGLVVGDSSLSPLDKLLIAIHSEGVLRRLTPSFKADNSRCNAMTVDIPIENPENITRLKKILKELNIDCQVGITEDRYTVFTFSLTDIIEEAVLDSVKSFGYVDIQEYNSLKATAFIDELLQWSGCTDNVVTYYTTNKEAVDKLQALSTLSNYGCTLDIHRDATTFKAEVGYRLTFSGEKERVYPYRDEVDYNGYVYCAEMPKGTLVTRRNGKISIQGNCIHIASYAHLIETLGMPDEIHAEFLNYKEMLAKHEYINQVSQRKATKKTVPLNIAIFSGFTEGLQLFSSFVMLLNFNRFGKMKGMGQIIAWSVADEEVHSEAMIKLFRAYIEENRSVWKDDLKQDIYEAAETMVKLEDDFIDLCFSKGGIEGLEPSELKEYIRYIADRRLISMGLKGIFKVKRNPLPWVELMLNSPKHTNFFENTATEYAKGALSGSWETVWKS